MKENFVIEYSDVVLFMKQKQRRKKRKERDKNKEAKESKKERQERREKGQEEERDREREIEKGGAPKKLRRNKGRHSKINKKCPFLGGKTRFFFVLQSKEWKGTTTNPKKQKIINKEGSGTKGPPHLALNLQNKKQKKTKKKQKRNNLTLKPSKKTKKQKTKKNQKHKKQKKKGKKKTKTQKCQKKELFSYQSNFAFFVGVQNFPFLTTWPKNAHPKNTIKIGVSATHFLENSFESRNGHFWKKKTQIQKFQLSFFFAFFFSNNNKKHKL